MGKSGAYNFSKMFLLLGVQSPYKIWVIAVITTFATDTKWSKIYFILGCPTTYSCHVDSVLLNSKFEANRSEYWNSKFKYSQIEYSNIFRRTWCFQISFLIFEDSKIGRWHFPCLHSYWKVLLLHDWAYSLTYVPIRLVKVGKLDVSVI